MKLLLAITLITYVFCADAALTGVTYAAAVDGTTDTTCVVKITAASDWVTSTDEFASSAADIIAVGQLFYSSSGTIADADPGLNAEFTVAQNAQVVSAFDCMMSEKGATMTAKTDNGSATATALAASSTTSAEGTCTIATAPDWMKTATAADKLTLLTETYAASKAMETLATGSSLTAVVWAPGTCDTSNNNNNNNESSGADHVTLIAGAAAVVGAVSFF